MERDSILESLKVLEHKVNSSKIIRNPEEMEGKVIESVKTVCIDSVSYMITKTTDNSVMCVSYTKCGDDFILDRMPDFDLKDIAIEELDFGYETHAYHIFDLYFEAGLITQSDREILNVYYPIVKENASIDLKVSRLEFAIKEAVAKEDFKKAEKLKGELDDLL